MAKKSHPINLIKTDENEIGNQVTNWTLTIGRLLVIIVEIIALSAFLYRFVLDNQLRDLNTKIKDHEVALNFLKDKEIVYRNLQDRLSLEKSLAAQGQGRIQILKDIFGFTPTGMTFTKIVMSSDNIRIEANFNSAAPLNNFINSLKSYALTDSISIDRIENRTASSIISTGVFVVLKNQGGRNASTSN